MAPSCGRAVISFESINSKTREHLSIPRPAHLAFQPEPRLTQFTILSNVNRQTDHATSSSIELAAEMRTRMLSDCSDWFPGKESTFQETSSTQWQKN
jgi:hypothetical protein